MGAEIDDESLQRIYTWVDDIPLSRPKRNIARDFADGVLLAEVVAHYFPKLVERHNYPAANSYAQKMYNWNTLNAKVLKKMNMHLNKDEMEALCACKPNAVERTLQTLQQKMAAYNARKEASGGSRASTPASSVARGGAPAPTPAARSAAKPPPQRVAADPSAVSAVATRLSGSGLHDGGAHDDKDAQIRELRETVDILEIKIQKLEQLVKLKDSKIATLQAKLH